MPWTADKDDLEKFVQQNFPASEAANFDETIVARAIDMATTKVNSALTFNGYDPTVIQATTTTDAFKWLDNLMLKIASERVLRWLKSSTPQASKLKMDELIKENEADLKTLLTDPSIVLSDLALPDNAPTSKIQNVIVASTDDPDLRPDAEFTRGDIKY